MFLWGSMRAPLMYSSSWIRTSSPSTETFSIRTCVWEEGCVCVCMCMYACVCMHGCVYVCMGISVCVYIRAWEKERGYGCVCTKCMWRVHNVYVCVHASCVCKWVCVTHDIVCMCMCA